MRTKPKVGVKICLIWRFRELSTLKIFVYLNLWVNKTKKMVLLGGVFVLSVAIFTGVTCSLIS